MAAAKIATKTQRHKVTQRVLLKVNPWCLRALVAIKAKIRIPGFLFLGFAYW